MNYLLIYFIMFSMFKTYVMYKILYISIYLDIH